LSGEVEVTVSEKSTAGYTLHWQPRMAPFAALADDADASAIGIRFRDFGLSLPLTLMLEPQDGFVEIRLTDAAAVRQRLLGELRRLTAAMPTPLDCADRDAQSSTLCTLLATDESVAAYIVRDVGPLFACSGVRLNPRQTEDWTTPHPSPEVGDAVMIRYHQEVIDYDPAAAALHARMTTTPDAEQLRAWMRKRLTGSPEMLIEKIVDKSAYQTSVDCTMERATGWPLRIERRMTAGSGPIRGVETARFERMAVVDKPHRKR